MNEILTRFRGIRALYGEDGFARLQQSHVLIVGVGGIGSWLAESLCRTAVGRLTLLDHDVIESGNSNRQLHTLSSTIGQYKADVLAARLCDINPQLKIATRKIRLTRDNIASELKDAPPFAVDCIDDLEAKAALADFLKRSGRCFICAGGAGGRTDPGRLRLADIAEARGDALISRLRNCLRKDYNYLKGGAKMGIMCTCSDEIPVYCPRDEDSDLPRFGASMCVTASAGLLLGSYIISQIVK